MGITSRTKRNEYEKDGVQMIYDLPIRDHNIKPHLDLEEEVTARQDGILTFTVRVNNGNIVDLNITEYVNARQKYGIITGIVKEELQLTYYPRERSQTNPIRDNNIHGGNTTGSGTGANTQHSEEQKA